ncbi:MAG TPA: hypothetical protein VHX38_02175 [Pseudonocardiaceae bacterium]|jgi:hypothetical protein|nr:hypothetical protein [Pseudonocardiaceae bacterium]
MGISPQPRDLGSRLTRVESQLATLTGRVPSLPHLAVPLYRLWSPALQTNTASAYSTVPASSAIGMATLWEGRVDYGSHPCLSIDGVWGDLDLMAPTITYRVVIGVLSYTWQATGQQTAKHLFDLRPVLEQSDLQVQLSISDIGTAAATDRLLCQPLGMYLRQMPVNGVFG